MLRQLGAGGDCKKSDKSTILDLGDRKFFLGKTIGEGTYSKVCLALLKYKGHHKFVACKIINKKKAGKDFIKKFLPREIRILRGISHPNIISLTDFIESTETVYMIMSYCKYGDLLEHIKEKGAFSEKKSKYIFRQIVSAIHYLHSREIAHRDLKCENIFMFTRTTIKLGDFGFARLCRHENSNNRVLSRTYCGSAAYAAPEIIEGAPYNPKMYDIWSMGCILYIMLTAQMPFDDSNIKKMLRFQQKRSIFYNIRNAVQSNDLRKLLFMILEPDVTRRATINIIIKSKWLRDSKFYK